MFSDIDKVVKECGRMSVVLRIDNELNLALQEILGYITDGIVTYLPNVKERIRRADANFAKERLPFYVELSVSQSLQNNVDMFYMEHGEKEWLYSEEAKISAEDRDLLMTFDVFDYVTAGLEPTKENGDWTKLVRKAIARGDNSYRFIGFSIGHYLDKAVGELKELVVARINPGSTKSRKKTLIN
ncbi:unnamed protein product, partial [Mesorhabditis spiculigera]